VQQLVLLQEIDPVLKPPSIFRSSVAALLHVEKELNAAAEALFQRRDGGGIDEVHLILPSATYHILHPC
jgi:hypothetical protein